MIEKELVTLDTIADKANVHIENGIDEHDAIARAIRESFSTETLRDIYALFDTTEYELANDIQHKLIMRRQSVERVYNEAKDEI